MPSSIPYIPSLFSIFPGSGENKEGPSSVVKHEDKGIFQKLKDVFWKPDDSDTEEKQTKQNRERMS